MTLDDFYALLAANRDKFVKVIVMPSFDEQPIDIIHVYEGRERCSTPLGFAALLVGGTLVLPGNAIEAQRKVIGMSRRDAEAVFNACQAVDGKVEAKYYNEYHTWDGAIRRHVLQALGKDDVDLAIANSSRR